MRVVVLLVPVLVVPLGWAVGPPPREPAEVTKAISQLADDDLATRRAAMTRLEAIGEPVVPALRKVGATHADVDVRLRAHAVAGAIEAKLFGEVRQFKGHTDGVINLAVSPDGKALASGAWLRHSEREVRLWDVASGKNVRTLTGHPGGAGALAFLPGGKQLLTGGNDRLLRLWDLETGKEVRDYTGHRGWLYALAVSGDGKTAVSACNADAPLCVWDVGTGKLLRHLNGHAQITRGLAFVPGTSRCLSASFDGTVRVWDTKAGKQLASLPHPPQAWFVAVRPDGKQAASVGINGKLCVWDLQTFKLLREVEAHSQQGSHGVAYSPDGKRILTCGYQADRTVRLWDADTGKALQVLDGHTDQALCVAFLPDGRHGVSGSYDRTLRLWRLRR